MWFVQDWRYQGSLKHWGVIIPVAHRETVFDLTESEVAATFRLLRRVKAWMDAEFSTRRLQRWLELRARRRPRTLPCPPACHSKVQTRTAGRARHQGASEVRSQSLVVRVSRDKRRSGV